MTRRIRARFVKQLLQRLWSCVWACQLRRHHQFVGCMSHLADRRRSRPTAAVTTNRRTQRPCPNRPARRRLHYASMPSHNRRITHMVTAAARCIMRITHTGNRRPPRLHYAHHSLQSPMRARTAQLYTAQPTPAPYPRIARPCPPSAPVPWGKGLFHGKSAFPPAQTLPPPQKPRKHPTKGRVVGGEGRAPYALFLLQFSKRHLATLEGLSHSLSFLGAWNFVLVTLAINSPTDPKAIIYLSL